MKLTNIHKALKSTKGEIGTLVVLIGMAVIGLGILVGSQVQNGRINLVPRAATSLLWNGAKPVNGSFYPWSGTGPTTGWESYLGNRVYICNGNYCWTLDATNPSNPVWADGGNAFYIPSNPSFNTTKPSANGTYMWSGNGPTAAWTWDVVYNGQNVNETLVCNGYYCWRYIRYANGSGEWRDGSDADTLPGDPLDMSATAFWNQKPLLWNSRGQIGPTVAWTDTINKQVTICNVGYCMSVNYQTWTWVRQIDPVPAPPGKFVAQYTSAWTSPGNNIIALCAANVCYKFTLTSGGGSWATEPEIMQLTAPTAAPVIPTSTPRPSNTPVPPRVTDTPTPTVTPRPSNTPIPTSTPIPSPTADVNRTYIINTQAVCSDGTLAPYPEVTYIGIWRTDMSSPILTTKTKSATGTYTIQTVLGHTFAFGFVYDPGHWMTVKTVPPGFTIRPPENIAVDFNTHTRPGTYTFTYYAPASWCTAPTAPPTATPQPTAVPTAVPTAAPTADPCSRLREGDANCNGIVNYENDPQDLQCWIGEARGNKPQGCVSADFNGNGIVSFTQDLMDFAIWKNTAVGR